MKITIIGIGYVGLSLAKVLSRKHEITCYDIDEKKLEEIEFSQDGEYKCNFTNISKVFTRKVAHSNSEIIFICVPTNLDETNNTLDTSNLEMALNDAMSYNPKAKIVIKSTLSMESIIVLNKYKDSLSIFYSPEFLRENTAFYDALHPSRIVIGYLKENELDEAKEIADLLKQCSENSNVPLIITELGNAIAIKLFSNAYLALRLSFFNELDTFAHNYHLNVSSIIEGVSLDSRIGNYYNRPSFGFKGYCLPKDTISLVKSFSGVQSALIPAILESNKKRLEYTINRILEIIKDKNYKSIGIYRIAMEKDAVSVRFSIMDDILKALQKCNLNIVIYEPLLEIDAYLNSKIVALNELLKCDLIIANRMSEELKSIKEKVFTWDISNNVNIIK